MGRKRMERTYIGIGSNLANPRRQVGEATAELADLPDSRLCARSWLYATAPVGPVEQPDFVNAAVALETRLTPSDLLGALQAIERRHGRTRTAHRWGPRTLDLDLLLYGEHEVAVPSLTVPHPEIHRRAFVLVPLADIAPLELLIPGQGRLEELLRVHPLGGVVRLTEPPCPAGVVPEPALSCC